MNLRYSVSMTARLYSCQNSGTYRDNSIGCIFFKLNNFIIFAQLKPIMLDFASKG